MAKKYKNTDIARAIYEETSGKTGPELNASLKKVVMFLGRQRLFSKSKNILSELKKISNQKAGLTEANIVSASALNPNTKKTLTEMLLKKYKTKGVVFNEKVDVKVLGGVKVEVGDEVIDLTLKNRINKLQEHLVAKL